ncbi:MAG: putative glycosyltransferase [Caulobacteraceae bacterium]|nr:putative glycosyltransferase [Caulobacteraceae bacterium]
MARLSPTTEQIVPPRAGPLQAPPRPACVLLVASNFPPILGGASVVYENLARRGKGRIIVLTASHSYVDGRELPGWRDYDRAAPYRILRRRLLRSQLRYGAALHGWRRLAWLAADVAQRIVTFATVLRFVVGDGVRTVCVGELLAGGWLLYLLRWAPGVRTVAYVHGEEMTTEHVWDAGHRRAQRALRQANEVVAVSRFSVEVAKGLVDPQAAGKLTLILNGVDQQRFRPQPRRTDLMRRYGLKGCFVFVCVCRLIQKKGVDHTIRAFEQVVAKHPDSRLLIVGKGPFEPELKALVSEVGLAERITFAGEVADAELPAHYALGDVFVMPNRALANGDTEGFGLVFLEANACGVPVIAGRDGGSVEAVEHGVNGLIVDGHSVEAVTAAMLRLREDGALRARLRQGGLARAAAADWCGKAEQFLQVCGA